ncbi:MAG TPA: hypothetical protein DEG06_05040 [Lachnospiraceae bacterium]|jgi:hypothetical protein|nr:hypothetical protein [Lachnospiraceae bacterium]HBY71590.1 hypothetical protein [Lachnospiraceae bacterium]HCM12092.1 hypothetical protein [Lachnospiraceae bacterium]
MVDNKLNLQTDPYDVKKHISQADLSFFLQDKMSSEEKVTFLEHICSCDYCSDLLAQSIEAELITAPVDMKANIISTISRPDQLVAKKVKEVSKRMQFLLYSLKVSAAAIGALIVLLAMNVNYTPNSPSRTEIRKEISIDRYNAPSITASIRSNMDDLSNRILEFSNIIMNKEVFEYDQKEK